MSETIRDLVIIIPAFRAVALLPATIESIVVQLSEAHGLDILIFIVDGNSNDGTVELVAGYRDRGVPIEIVSEPDKGIYDAMNKGLKLRPARFSYFIGAGDCLLAGALKGVAPHIAAADGLTIICGIVLREGKPWQSKLGRWRLARSNACHQAIFYSREVFDRVGVYDLKYPLLADWALNIRCLGERDIRVKHVDVPICSYLGGGASEQRFDHAFAADQQRLIRKHLGFGPSAFVRGELALRDGLRSLAAKLGLLERYRRRR